MHQVPGVSSAPFFPIFPNDTNGTGLRILADTATFGYDALGNVTQAYNRDAKIDRTYFANGALRTDTVAISNYTVTPSGISTGSPWVYGLRQSTTATAGGRCCTSRGR